VLRVTLPADAFRPGTATPVIEFKPSGAEGVPL
jgi:hypothetical protein